MAQILTIFGFDGYSSGDSTSLALMQFTFFVLFLALFLLYWFDPILIQSA